jgi:hypothetical protein
LINRISPLFGKIDLNDCFVSTVNLTYKSIEATTNDSDAAPAAPEKYLVGINRYPAITAIAKLKILMKINPPYLPSLK